MKNLIIGFLHRIFGYENYLKYFTIFKISVLRFDKRKTNFLFFSKILPKDANVMVVGACTGITTIPLAKRYPERKIFAYEPLPSNFRALRKAVDFFSLTNINSYNVGLGNKSSLMEMVLPVFQGVKKQGLAYLDVPSIEGFSHGIKEEVSIDRLDERDELLEIPIEGFKLIAENFEFEVLQGGEKLLKKKKPLIYCELWDNKNRLKVFDLIRSYGYTINVRNKNELVKYDPEIHKQRYFFFSYE